MKIKFTDEHFAKLKELAVQALLVGTTFRTKLGQSLNIYELVHTVSINQLNEIKNGLAKQIEKIEGGDEWIDPDSERLEGLKTSKELVNLIIGLKRYSAEREENKRKKEELSAKLAELKESQKTPEDRIKELEAQLKELEEF